MIYVGPLKVDEKLAARTQTILQSSIGFEEAIAFLRLQGESKIDTIRMLVVTANLGLGEAKRIVHLSPAWHDRRAHDDAFHDSLVQAVDALQDSGDDLAHSSLLEAAAPR